MPSSRGALVAPLVVLLLSATTPPATERLTEAEAITRFLAESPLVRLGALRAGALRATTRTDALVRNPELFYSVEEAGESRDEFFIVEQELPITGRRALARKSAERVSSAAHLEAEAELRRAVGALRAAFTEITYRKRELEILRSGAAELSQTIEILYERERQGEGSGYDTNRAEQELTGLSLQIARVETELAGASARFGSFFPESSQVRSAEIEGDLVLSSAPPDPDVAVAFAFEHRSELLALQAAAELHELERRAARRSRVPEPVLAAGIKRIESPGESDTGYVASISIPIPLFNRGQHAESRARAESGVVEVEREILSRQVEAEVLAAHAKARGTREMALSADDLVGRAGELSRIAQVAYEEGEHGILERLDAHRTSLQGWLLALETRYEARRAEIELDSAMGMEVRP